MEQDCLTFSNKIQAIIKQYTCKIKNRAKKNSHPWLNYTIYKLMKEGDPALKKSIKTKLQHDKYQYTTLRNKVMREIRKAKSKKM